MSFTRARPPRRPVGSVLVPTGVAALVVALFALVVGLGTGGAVAVRYIDDVATALAAFAAATLCLRAASMQWGRMRWFWLLMGTACGFWTLAELLWAVYDLVLAEPVPVPSLADVGYLTAIPLAIGALLCHPATRVNRVRSARYVFDALLIGTALLFLGWTLVLGPLWRSTDLSTLGGVVALAYPFGDVAITFFIILVVRGMRGENRFALWCLLGGLLAMVISDSTYAYLVEVKNYATGNMIDVGWVVGYVGIALGAYCSRPAGPSERRAVAPAPGLAVLFAPFALVLLALAVGGVELALGRHLDHVAKGTMLALIVLVLARQGTLLLEIVGSRGDMAERLTRAAAGGQFPQFEAAGHDVNGVGDRAATVVGP